MSIDIEAQEDQLEIDQLSPIMEWPYTSVFDVAEDGQRFLAVKSLEDEDLVDDDAEMRVFVVQNWIEEVRGMLGN